MDVGALASALVGAQTGRVQLAVAAKMLQMSTDAANSVVQLIDSADASTNRLASVGAGIGTNLDVSV